MFILEKPYVSDFLKDTLQEISNKVLANEVACASMKGSSSLLVSAEEFRNAYAKNQNQPLYSNSENAIDWIDSNLNSAELSRTIRLFKDKSAFRDLVRDLYPDFKYLTVNFDELDRIDPKDIPIPCVIKPSVGFFSLGVHMVEKREDWTSTVTTIHNEVDHIKSMYPAKVLELDKFIIEECIEGEEFAVDAYFGSDGTPVILNILGHLFASSEDVSDRCYITSTKIIRENREDFQALLTEIGNRADLHNFPVHIELRKDSHGNIGVIEVNPMRFAGWCVTDIAHYAYGINPYKYYMGGMKPEWDKIEKCCEGKVYAMIIGDISSSVDRANIKSVDYDGFKANFSKTLELRQIDYREYPVFAFIFAEVAETNMKELEKMLHADFGEYLILD